MRRIQFCVLTAIVACGPSKLHHGDGGGSGDGGNGQPHTLSGITITPTNPIVELDLNATGAQGFTATGNYLDNVDEDLTNAVTWTVVNPAVGAMTAATLAIPAFAADGAVVSRINADYSGLEGIAQITVVSYRRSGSQQDFFFDLPYQTPDVTKPLDFSTAIPAIDVFFSMDTTGSMEGEISNLQTALTGTVVPGIQAAVANSAFGVGAQEDFPISPYGSAGVDQPFILEQAITTVTSLVATGVGKLSSGGAPIGSGADGPEAGLEAIYQIVTGEGLTGPSPTNVPANHTGIGGVGFRTGTMPIVVGISDADSHRISPDIGNCGTTSDAYAGTVAAVAHSLTQTETAMTNICSRFVGIAPQFAGDTCDAQIYQEELATYTGARVPPAAWDVGTRPTGCAETQCCTGVSGVGRAPDGNGLCPLVFIANTDGTGVSTSIVTGIQMLTRFATFTATTMKTGGTTDNMNNPLPAGHTTADFISAITPVSFVKPPPPPVLPDPTFDATSFYGVTPGTKVDFNVVATNTFVSQTAQAQIFMATITVLASGCTPLDQRTVIILVPPNAIVIQ